MSEQFNEGLPEVPDLIIKDLEITQKAEVRDGFHLDPQQREELAGRDEKELNIDTDDIANLVLKAQHCRRVLRRGHTMMSDPVGRNLMETLKIKRAELELMKLNSNDPKIDLLIKEIDKLH